MSGSGSFVQFDNSRVAQAGGLIEDAGNAFTQRRQTEEKFVKKVLKDPIQTSEPKKANGEAPSAPAPAAETPAPVKPAPGKPKPTPLTPEAQQRRDEANKRRRDKRASDRDAGVKPVPRPVKPKPDTPKPSPAPKPTPKPDSAPTTAVKSEGTGSTKYAQILLPIKKPNQQEFDKFKEAGPAFQGVHAPGPIYSASNPYIPPQKKTTPPPVK
jgi:hypothetical protein